MMPEYLSVAFAVQDNLSASLSVLGAFCAIIGDLTRAPMAPKRKRPRRVQRKIDARHGYQHYQVAALRRLGKTL